MPTGKYNRTPEQLATARINLAKGRGTAAREKAAQTVRQLVADPLWRQKVSENTRKAMRDPLIRQRHLEALKTVRESYGIAFRGGNGQSPTPAMRLVAAILEPLGFIREYPVKTRGHGTNETPPTSYKVDFGNPLTKTAIEMDGVCHHTRDRQELDRKKTQVLESLGWKVIRLKH